MTGSASHSRPAAYRRRSVAPLFTLGALLFLIAAARGYAGPDDRWINGLLPEALRRQGPFGMFWWQWLALPALTLVAFVLGRLLGRMSRAALRALVQRTNTVWADRLLLAVAPPLSVVWSVLAANALLPAIVLKPSIQGAVRSLLAAGLIIAIVSVLWRSVSVVRELLLTRASVANHSSARSLLSLGAVLTRALIVMIGILAVASAFGYPLNTALTGLGIGGIAVALGAQKTLENLFGSLSIAIDEPFRVDDQVTVDGVTGTVERLGFRSTRIRTADRTLVTIPNGKLADMRIETLAARDRRRFTMTLSLVQSSTSAQTTRVIDGVKRVLRSHPRVWPETVIVSLAGIGAYDIEIIAWFETTDEIEFRGFRDEVLLAFMEVVDEAGTRVAGQPRRVQFVGGSRP